MNDIRIFAATYLEQMDMQLERKVCLMIPSPR